MIKTFWNGKHPEMAMMNDVMKRHMPAEGPTAFVETELLRCLNRISYDYFNNGFGNNLSQAVAYVDRYHVPYASVAFIDAWTPIRDMALAGAPVASDERIDEWITLLMAEILGRIGLSQRIGRFIPIEFEMYDMPSVEPTFDPEMQAA